jgi:hypothetical protein
MCTGIVIANEMKQSHNRVGLLFLRPAICLIMLFLFHPSFASGFSPGDSLKNKYDINDPRNPDCPCHKYQQQANREYRQLLNNENNFSNVSDNQSDEGSDEGSSWGGDSNNGSSHTKGSGQGSGLIKISGRGNTKVDKIFIKQHISFNLFGFQNRKKKFGKTRSKPVKHRVMKCRVSDKLTRCFHW